MVVESVEPGCLFTASLYVTGARKNTKNNQDTLFLLKKDELVTTQTSVQ